MVQTILGCPTGTNFMCPVNNSVQVDYIPQFSFCVIIPLAFILALGSGKSRRNLHLAPHDTC